MHPAHYFFVLFTMHFLLRVLVLLWWVYEIWFTGEHQKKILPGDYMSQQLLHLHKIQWERKVTALSVFPFYSRTLRYAVTHPLLETGHCPVSNSQSIVEHKINQCRQKGNRVKWKQWSNEMFWDSHQGTKIRWGDWLKNPLIPEAVSVKFMINCEYFGCNTLLQHH